MKFHISKLFWALRAILYKPFYGHIGMPTYIGKPILISGCKRICIGKRVRIFPHARIEALKNGSIKICDNVYIGPNSHITSDGSELSIESGTAIMSNVCITNIDHNYEDITKPILEQGITTRKTRIGKNCFIGHGAVIQAGVQLGNHVIVGANAVVIRGGVPDNSVLAGVPAKVVKVYNNSKKEWEKVKP